MRDVINIRLLWSEIWVRPVLWIQTKAEISIANPKGKIEISLWVINEMIGLTAGLPSDVDSNWELAMREQTMLTVVMYSVLAKSMIELPAIDD